MNFEVPNLLLLTNGVNSREELMEFLRSECGRVVDVMTMSTDAQAQVISPDQRYQVMLLDSFFLPGEASNSMEAYLDFIHDLKVRCPGTEVLFLPSQEGENVSSSLRVGLLRHSSGTITPDELASAVRDAMEYQKLREAERRKQLLEQLMKTSSVLLSGRSRQEVLERLLQAVRENGFDRVRLYLLSEDRQSLIGLAEAGMKYSDFIGVSWPVAQDRHFQQLLKDPRLRVFSRDTGEPKHSEERLDKEGVNEWVSVPLLLRGVVVGQMSADNKYSRRAINEQKLAPLGLFAAQAAAAIEKADLIEKADSRTKQLEALRRTTLAITSPSAMDRQTLVRTVIEQAVELLRAKSGGIYEYHPERGELELIADHNRSDFVGNILKVGDGMAGRLVQSGEPFRIVDDYNIHPERATVFACGRRFGAVLEVPLRWQERVVGVLYVDDDVGRKFTPEDARLLGMFADQSAIAMVNHELIAHDEDRLTRLEKLSRATTEIIGNLGKLSLRELLTQIVRHAADILSAEVCTIMLAKDEETLSLEAIFGCGDGDSAYGKQFRIPSYFKTGLTGHIVYEGKVYNAHGEGLANHFAARPSESFHEPTGKCYSLLAIPLKKKEGDHEKLIGLLCADNKKGEDGRPHPTLAFNKEDEWILSIFAETVVVCLESARLVEQLTRQREIKDRVIDTLPHAVIAVDLRGAVTDFNEQAARILGYAQDQILGAPVSSLYYDEREPRKIGKLLRGSKEGKLVNYETTLKDKLGQPIYIRLTAIWLYDESGERIGSVGYFEDIRLLKEYKRRVELLLNASNIMAQAQDLRAGLQRLAEMIVTLLPNTFCRILLFGDSDSHATAEAAAYFSSHDNDELKWEPGVGERFAASDYEGLAKLLRRGKPITLRYNDHRVRQNLEKFSERLGLNRHVQSLLLVPLKLGDRMLGMLNMGECCDEAQSQFTPENIELVSAIAAQSNIFIERMLTLKFAEHGRERLLSFYRVSNNLSMVQDPEQLLRSIVREILDAAGAKSVHLILIDEQKRWRNPISVTHEGFSNESVTVRSDGVSMNVFRTGVAEVIPDTEKERGRVSPILLLGAGAAVCLPMSLPHKRIGVIWVDYAHPRRFEEAELVSLQLYVSQAAIAYENAQEVERLGRSREAADALSRETETDRVLEQMVLSARKTLRADGVVFSFFDNERGTFIQDRSLAHGIPGEVWNRHQKAGPNIGGTVYRLMKQGWVFIGDVNDPQAPQKIGPNTRRLLTDFGARSMQGGALRVGKETLGVIYALYHDQYSFGEGERLTSQAFARYAALALKRAKLIEQVLKTNEAAGAVTKIMKLGDRRATLEAIVAEVKKATSCDAVVLFEYDRNKRRLMPPTVTGVHNLETMYSPVEEQDYPLVYRLLEEDEPRIVEHVSEEPDFKDRRFAKDEGVKSCIAIPLKATGERVGVMFVNYRRQAKLTAEEIHTIQLFADQAAVAVHYAQFIEERAKKLRENAQGALVQLSLELRRAESPQEMMNCAVVLAADALGVERCNLVMPDQNGDLILRAQIGWDEGLTGNLRLEKDTGSQTGYTIMTKQPVVVDDYRAEREFKVPPVVLESGIRSGMSVPMFRDGEVVGALLVYMERFRQFTEEEATLLSLIADRTAVAIRGAERYEELNRISKHLQAVHNASKAITASFGREKEVLDWIVREAVEGVTGLRGPKAVIGTIQLFNEERNELTFQNIYPLSAVSGLIQRIGTKWSLDEDKIGVTGQTVRNRESQLVSDVSVDPNYLKMNESTRSELSVPLQYEGRILGAINVESDQINGFDKEDQTALEALAEIAVIAIKNARQYEELRRTHEELRRTHEELKETRNRVEASTSLAWLGMSNNAWRHIIAGQAAEIRNRTTLIRELVKKTDVGRERIADHLDRIESLIKSILEKPITPPLSSEQGVTEVNINDLVIERLNQLRQNERYSAVRLEALPSPSPNLCVLASSEWLRRALDILVDNATEAVRTLSPERRLVEVITGLKEDQVEIIVRDHGEGISEEIERQIFKKRIERSEGMGLGLLITQAVVETYGGRIFLGKNNSQGAEVVIRLPHKS